MQVHVVYLRPMTINNTNNVVVDRNSITTSYNDISNTEMQMRVIADTSIPNSVGNPTIKDFLVAEAAANFKLQYISNTMIITYNG